MDASRSTSPAAAGAWLVGRSPALAALRSAVDDAVGGRGGLVLITGDPGIGKTALATAGAAHAARRAARVAWASCWDGGGTPGYWPWTQVLRALDLGPDLLEQGPGGNGAPDEQGSRFRLFDFVTRRLLRVAEDRPLVLVLDDLQWADASSVRLLTFLARRLATAPVLVVATYRDVDVAAPDHPLHGLLPAVAERSRILPLAGLGPDAVAVLVRRSLDRPVPDDVVADVHRRTGGNPFFVEQLAQLFGAPTGDGTPEIPPVVQDVVARRLDRLSRATLQLLEAGAVIGTEFDVGTAASAAGLRAGAVLQALHEAERRRVVGAGDPARARFAHDLFREVLHARLPRQRRCELHLAVAEQLEAHRDAGGVVPPQELAHHRAAALPLGDRARAVDALLDAGRDATRLGAFDEAARFYRRALGAPERGDPPIAPHVLVEYGHALRRAGRPDAAYVQFLAAAERARAAPDASLLAAAALGAHRVATRTDVAHAEVVALLEDALQRAAPGATVDRCLVLAALARELSDGPARDEPRADALAGQAVREARASSDGSVLAAALWAQLDVRWRPGTARERLRLTDELEAVARGAGDQELVLEAMFTRLVARLELADPAWSTELDAFDRLTDELRVPHYRYLALSRRASRACLTGPLDRADALVDEAAAYGEQVGEPDAWGVRASQWVGLAMLRGDWCRIQALADAAGRPLVPPPFAPLLQAHLHLERGDTAAAAALVTGFGDLTDAGYRWRRISWLAELAELAAVVGGPDLCARLYGQLRPEAQTFGVLGGAVFTTGPVALQLGLLAAALGRADDAVDHLEHAVALAERIAAAVFVVRCRFELATALLARGRAQDRPRAGELLADVAARAGPLGMPALRQRARALAADRPPCVFRREGEVWALTYADRTARLRDAKGLHDLARLLAAPGQEVPATDLLGVAPAGADPVLDEQARAAFKRRVAELDARLAHADAAGDAEGGAALSAERDILVRELVSASGLGGRRRRLGDAAERARTTVTARVRDSLRRIEQVHPELGAHLHASVHTGARCCYRPPRPIRWTT